MRDSTEAERCRECGQEYYHGGDHGLCPECLPLSWQVTIRKTDVSIAVIVVTADSPEEATDEAERRAWNDSAVVWELQDPMVHFVQTTNCESISNCHLNGKKGEGDEDRNEV